MSLGVLQTDPKGLYDLFDASHSPLEQWWSKATRSHTWGKVQMIEVCTLQEEKLPGIIGSKWLCS